MDLQFDDVVNLLHISKNTLQRWVDKKHIPYYTISGKLRFNRLELEEWLMESVANSVDLPFGESDDGSSTWNKYCLYRAIHKGCVLDDVTGSSKEEVIYRVMSEASNILNINGDIVSELLIERENMMSTALGGGIAVPHTRDFLLHDYTDAAVVVYLKKPIDWNAIDGTMTDTCIFLFACDDKRHLNLLAKVAHLTRIDEIKSILEVRPGKEKLLESILFFEKNLPIYDSLVSP